MYLISSFDHTIHLELALTQLEQIGITKDNLYAVPLNVFPEETRLFDTIHHADGVSLLDTSLAWATALTVVGTSYGFILRWGPIVWGFIGAVTGLLIGYILDLIVHKKRRSKTKNATVEPNVFILVHCDRHMTDKVKAILREHHAINYGVIEVSN
jgi:hypothetical protein